MTALAAQLRARIAADGPLRLDAWMAACNAAYYAGPNPLGRDFTTAPEISQMFGELIGGWIGDVWQRAGQPPVRLVELGPGRGTLMADARRVLARLPGLADAPLALVETSPALRAMQAGRLAADWYDRLEDVPDDRATILIANEFFDALPIRQFDGRGGEVAVTVTDTGFAATTLPAPGTTAGERCAAGETIASQIADRLTHHGGAALIIDYGYAGQQAHDSLQALRHAASADAFADPGSADLTAHVDFSALAHAATGATTHGPVTHGPVTQGVWLSRLGIEARAATLQARNRDAAAAISAALVRLTAPAQMGTLFKVMALSAPHWPQPAGFDA